MHPYIQGIQDQVNKNEIINRLKSALADELISNFNYKMQAKLIQGFHKEEIKKELIQHSQEEQLHADLLMERISELGGNPEIRPMDWDKFSTCKYSPVFSNDQKDILEAAIGGERCAVKGYTALAEFLESRDSTTYGLIHRILKDEYEHIRDLTKLLNEIHESIPNNPRSTENQDEQPDQEAKE